jgi:hypothetical protein
MVFLFASIFLFSDVALWVIIQTTFSINWQNARKKLLKLKKIGKKFCGML